MSHHPYLFYIAIAGGLVASEAPTQPIGLAGILVALTGLLGGATQLFSRWVDYRQAQMRRADQDAKIAGLEAQLQETKAELEASKERNHERSDHVNGLVSQIQERVQTNSTSLKATVATTRDLAARQGVEANIPEPAEPIH